MHNSKTKHYFSPLSATPSIQSVLSNIGQRICYLPSFAYLNLAFLAHSCRTTDVKCLLIITNWLVKEQRCIAHINDSLIRSNLIDSIDEHLIDEDRVGDAGRPLTSSTSTALCVVRICIAAILTTIFAAGLFSDAQFCPLSAVALQTVVYLIVSPRQLPCQQPYLQLY